MPLCAPPWGTPEGVFHCEVSGAREDGSGRLQLGGEEVLTASHSSRGRPHSLVLGPEPRAKSSVCIYVQVSWGGYWPYWLAAAQSAAQSAAQLRSSQICGAA